MQGWSEWLSECSRTWLIRFRFVQFSGANVSDREQKKWPNTVALILPVNTFPKNTTLRLSTSPNCSRMVDFLAAKRREARMIERTRCLPQQLLLSTRLPVSHENTSMHCFLFQYQQISQVVTCCIRSCRRQAFCILCVCGNVLPFPVAGIVVRVSCFTLAALYSSVAHQLECVSVSRRLF